MDLLLGEDARERSAIVIWECPGYPNEVLFG